MHSSVGRTSPQTWTKLASLLSTQHPSQANPRSSHRRCISGYLDILAKSKGFISMYIKLLGCVTLVKHLKHHSRLRWQSELSITLTPISHMRKWILRVLCHLLRNIQVSQAHTHELDHEAFAGTALICSQNINRNTALCVKANSCLLTGFTFGVHC